LPFRKLRILSLVTDGFGAEGGIARYNCDLMTALSQSDRVTKVIVLPRFALAAAETPAKVRQLAPSANKGMWSCRALSCVAKERFNVVFCGHLNAVPLAYAAARLARAKLWVQVHGIEAWHPRGRLHRSAIDGAKLVTSVSRFTRHKLLSWAKVPPHRVRVLPNTVGPSYFPSEKRRDLVEKHALDGKRVILTAGRLSLSERYKGHDRIMRALPEVIHQVPNAVYLIVGAGDDRQRLEQLAGESGLTGRVVFAGHVPAGRLSDYYSLADVFAMPSTGEGFGIVFLEAAACGLPIIGGNADGSVDALGDGQIGCLVDPESHEQVTAALISALQGGLAANVAGVRRFSFGNFSRHVDELIQDIAR
jgi:phosphatidyl-myo-inositol dimannoside synthase